MSATLGRLAVDLALDPADVHSTGTGCFNRAPGHASSCKSRLMKACALAPQATLEPREGGLPPILPRP